MFHVSDDCVKWRKLPEEHGLRGFVTIYQGSCPCISIDVFEVVKSTGKILRRYEEETRWSSFVALSFCSTPETWARAVFNADGSRESVKPQDDEPKCPYTELTIQDSDINLLAALKHEMGDDFP